MLHDEHKKIQEERMLQRVYLEGEGRVTRAQLNAIYWGGITTGALISSGIIFFVLFMNKFGG